MNIPAASKTDCPHCAAKARDYDAECRSCFIRSIAHMPIKHRGARYTQIAFKHGTTVMTKISDEVTAWHKENKSWGTFT